MTEMSETTDVATVTSPEVEAAFARVRKVLDPMDGKFPDFEDLALALAHPTGWRERRVYLAAHLLTIAQDPSVGPPENPDRQLTLPEMEALLPAVRAIRLSVGASSSAAFWVRERINALHAPQGELIVAILNVVDDLLATFVRNLENEVMCAVSDAMLTTLEIP